MCTGGQQDEDEDEEKEKEKEKGKGKGKGKGGEGEGRGGEGGRRRGGEEERRRKERRERIYKTMIIPKMAGDMHPYVADLPVPLHLHFPWEKIGILKLGRAKLSADNFPPEYRSHEFWRSEEEFMPQAAPGGYKSAPRDFALERE